MNTKRKNDILFAKTRSSNAIHELYIPVVKVLTEKKSTAPNSARVSIATGDKPATIAGRAAGNINLNNDSNFENPKLLPKSIRF